jgi:hypothetical protein
LRDQNNTTTTDFQITHGTHRHTSRGHYFVEAERHLGMAVDLIEKGRNDSATGATKTCVLILDLLTSIQIPLRRLGNIRSENTMSPGRSGGNVEKTSTPLGVLPSL